jgi:hypothetical protein
MIDVREQLLERIVTTLNGITATSPSTPFTTVQRNASELTEAEKPGAILLDGVEQILTSPARRSEVQMPGASFTLRPQVFVVLPMRDNVKTNLTLNDLPAPIGPLISLYRNAVINAVLWDGTLLALCSSGSLIYEGCETDMQTGSTIGSFGATILLKFAFTYALNPQDLLT